MPESSRRTDSSSPLLLLVEDERALRKVMEMVLEGEGYDVLTATDGREGLKLLAKNSPDLIITDYMMPEMDGAEMVRRIKGNPRTARIPILLMSAALPHDLPERRLVDCFLEKTGELADLLSTIRRLLAGPAGDAAD
ncbi:response regulator [Pseudomonas sp.]|jgi:CheY-like chemotaxis protein|uniref:response regulator n=1 Tax=Pseudomonas sp. TaxID=306 RepID=UPI002729BE31|nr:response regulator [Pseudomonas sp.]